MIEQVISGGQSGADIGGLIAAKKFGLKTGGMMPLGFRTENGFKPEYVQIYGVHESTSDSYPPRTFSNVKNSDGTMRFAVDFNTAGERCTLRAINQYSKPCFDVDVWKSPIYSDIKIWIDESNIRILNVAGNCESRYLGMTDFVVRYLSGLFEFLGLKEVTNG